MADRDGYHTKIENFFIRRANADDCETILGFIKQLAEYEDMIDCVVATADKIKETVFEKEYAEVLIAEFEGKPVGFSLFFHNYSTFLAKPGIYLEDVYIIPEMRKKGFGNEIFDVLKRIAVERDCGRLEWSCLDWNEPSIKFYKSMGAQAMDEWTVYRLTF